MAHYLPTLEGKILARFKADTGVGGFFESSAWTLITAARNTSTSAGAAAPFIVYQVTAATTNDTFDGRIRNVEIEFHLFVERDKGSAYAGMTIADSVLARLEGDWEDQASHTPTFGFDHFQPDISASGWTADNLQSVDLRTEHDDSYYHYVYTLTTIVRKAAQ